MSTLMRNAVLLLLTLLIAFGASLLARALLGQREAHHNAWSATLSYIATAYGVVVGFSILFLFGQFANAKQSVSDEATSIGTAYDEASLFPEGKLAMQRALLCYARAVSMYDWPALEAHQGGSARVDAAYQALVLSVGVGDGPPNGALHAATATNLLAQIGTISTARETRLLTAETRLPPLLWVLLAGGGVFVNLMIFAIALPARRLTQAALVAMSAVFTVVLVMLVVGLSNPFTSGAGRVTPRLIDEATASMSRGAPASVTAPCKP